MYTGLTLVILIHKCITVDLEPPRAICKRLKLCILLKACVFTVPICSGYTPSKLIAIHTLRKNKIKGIHYLNEKGYLYIARKCEIQSQADMDYV